MPVFLKYLMFDLLVVHVVWTSVDEFKLLTDMFIITILPIYPKNN